MKDIVDIKDFLFTIDDVGDWEGQEEEVTDRLNDLYHVAWVLIPDDMSSQRIEECLNGIWEQLRGDLALIDAEMDELVDWVTVYTNSFIEDSE